VKYVPISFCSCCPPFNKHADTNGYYGNQHPADHIKNGGEPTQGVFAVILRIKIHTASPSTQRSASHIHPGRFQGFCDFFAGFQARLCITEDLTLTPGFFMAGSASGRRFDFSTFPAALRV
jgi:hypothetical protein